MTLSMFISALGLPRIGPEIATLICSEVETLDELIDMLSHREKAVESITESLFSRQSI